MKILIASIFFDELQQAFPLFYESLQKLAHADKKIILIDLSEFKRIDAKLVEPLVEVRRMPRSQNSMQQITDLRNQFVAEAVSGKFDALLFLQPNIFPPMDLIQRLHRSGKNAIAPAFYTVKGNTVFSNAVKLAGTGASRALEPIPFEELLPGRVLEVFGASPEVLFLTSPAFKGLHFKEVKNPVEEIVHLASGLRKQGHNLFLDSSTVCAKYSDLNLFGYYYSKLAEFSNNQNRSLEV